MKQIKKEIEEFREDLKHGSLLGKIVIIVIICMTFFYTIVYLSIPKEQREVYFALIRVQDALDKRISHLEYLADKYGTMEDDLWEYMGIEYTPQEEVFNNPKATKIRKIKK